MVCAAHALQQVIQNLNSQAQILTQLQHLLFEVPEWPYKQLLLTFARTRYTDW